jgi:hypothetical protein
MQKKSAFLLGVFALCASNLFAQSKSVIVVQPFSATADATWPYDMKLMQTQTVAELKAKLGKQFDIVTEAPADAKAKVYTLSGEVTGWRPGNAAKRMLVGMGSGRESADIRYWIIDETGERKFDHKDTIRAEFYSNNYAGSVGQLAHPFASKIAKRLDDAKLK